MDARTQAHPAKARALVQPQQPVGACRCRVQTIYRAALLAFLFFSLSSTHQLLLFHHREYNKVFRILNSKYPAFNHQPQLHNHNTKMRASFALFAAVAAAVPQASILPISQISDGQIQAPPATVVPPVVAPSASVPAAASSVPAVVPSVPVSAPAGKPILYTSISEHHMY
jgi:hypothetical protein